MTNLGGWSHLVTNTSTDRHYDLTFEGTRVFIPLAASGCGYGCTYCYVPNFDERSTPLTSQDMVDYVERIRTDSRFVPGPTGTIFGLGCDTEPFNSRTNIDNVLYLFEAAAATSNPIQVATKTPLPTRVRAALENHAGPRPVVYTSFTCVRSAPLVEPSAPPPALRAANFAIHGDSWTSAAMIKPVTPTTARERVGLRLLLTDNKPDFIVVGSTYTSTTDADEQPHPLANTWTSPGLSSAADAVASEMSRLGVPIYAHSLCGCANTWRSAHALEVYNDYEELCTKCGLCDERKPEWEQ